MARIAVGVIDDHEVFRRGLLACLNEDPDLDVAELVPGMPVSSAIDVVVMSDDAASPMPLQCPTVVCFSIESQAVRLAEQPEVFAVLPRRSVTPDQLIASVHAAAVGLHVNCDSSGEGVLSDRGRDVLELLSRGADTREISARLGYSERTIKAAISEAQTLLGTRNRTHAVAEAVRAKLI